MQPNTSDSSKTIAGMQNSAESIGGWRSDDTDKVKYPHESSTDEKIESSVPPHSLDSDTETCPTQTVVDIEKNATDPEGGMFGRALSRITSRSIAPPSPPPDGGLNAWLCVLGTHLVVMNTWGVVTSFGAFQSYYVESLDRSPSDIAWIGSIEIFLLLFTGTITGRLTDAGYFYPVAILGSILVVLGTLMTSICTQYWQIFLAQGICVGLGNGCLFCPAVALVSTYFGKRRSLAIGITACGSGLGGIIFPLLIQELLPRVGFGWSVRIIGFIQAGSLIVAILCLKPRTTARKAGDLVEWAAFKDLKYTFYAIGCFMLYLGSFFAFFFIAAYSRDIQGMTYTTSLRLIMVMNGVGTVGRLVLSHMADRFGTLTTFIPTAGAGAILMFSWISISSTVGLYAWTALSGIAYGGIMALFPSALAALTTDPRTQGTRIGMVFTVVSFSVLIGPPITGALLSALDGRYLGAQLFAGGSLAVGTVFLALARETERRRQGGKFQGKI